MSNYEIKSISIPVKKAFEQGISFAVKEAIKDKLGTRDFTFEGILRKSIDARRRSSVKYIITAHISTKGELPEHRDIRPFANFEYEHIEKGNCKLKNRPVIAGSGPAGLFCALVLAEHGFRPLVIERGGNIEKRQKAVKEFWKGQELDENTNVQFGEGGAGTFSDGKLVTRINDPRCGFVLRTMVLQGADEEILYESRPHIGTDRLATVIKNIRERIISLGGTFMFENTVTDIIVKNGCIQGIELDNNIKIETDILIAAIGHSARDTFTMLRNNGISMEQKAFSAGLRIEHLQASVNNSQWGSNTKYIPEASEYSANIKMPERNAYTFCMCPGGVVVDASSEREMLVVNGMSYSSRNGKNANSAWVVEVKKTDFSSTDPLAGVELQREIEKTSYASGGAKGYAPVQKLLDFMQGQISKNFGSVNPSFTGKTVFADLNNILPGYLANALKNSLKGFSNRLSFFSNPDAVLTGCETRTSSPVRLLRDKKMQSIGTKGLYPAGEGAGYAGGIMSASVDGVKVAEAIIKRYNYLG